MSHARTLVALAAALAAFMVTAMLGNWQMRRAQEKTALQAEWDRAAGAEPLPVAGAVLDAVGRQLPLRVRLQGRLLAEHEVWLDNRQMNGQSGLLLITPLRLADGSVVLVNRGFARRDPRDRAKLPEVARPEGDLIIDGLAVAQPARVMQLGENAPDGRGRPLVWQNFDFDGFERASGFAVPRWVVQQTGGPDDGLQRNWPPLAAGVDKHRGYALQWYSLAALIAVLTLWFGARAWLNGRQPTSGPGNE